MNIVTVALKGRPITHYPPVDQRKHPIAVRRVDDRPSTNQVPCVYKRKLAQ